MIRAMLINDTRTECHHGCDAVCENLLSLLSRHGITIVNSVPVATYVEGAKFVEMLKGVRLVLINGEGTIHHARHFGRHILDLGALARQEGRQVFLINATWDTNNEEMARIVAGFNGVYVRDTASKRQLDMCGVSSKTVPDLSFLTDISGCARDGDGVVIYDSVLEEVSSILSDYADILGASRVSIHRKSPVLRGNSGGRLVRKLLGLGGETATRIIDNLGGYRTIMSRTEWLAFMSAHSFVITGRFHAACFSLLLGIPFVAIESNSNKITALLEDVGLNPARLLPKVSDKRELVKTCQELRNYSHVEQQNIKIYLNRAQQSAGHMLLDIMRLIRQVQPSAAT